MRPAGLFGLRQRTAGINEVHPRRSVRVDAGIGCRTISGRPGIDSYWARVGNRDAYMRAQEIDEAAAADS